ncbi:hypothetical protein ACB098_06G132100 [Castanea mollissima]
MYIVVISSSINSCCLSTSGTNYYTPPFLNPLSLHRDGRQRLGSGSMGILHRLNNQSHCVIHQKLQHMRDRLGNKKWIGWQVRNRRLPVISRHRVSPISKAKHLYKK